MEAVSVLRPTTSVQTACQVLGMSRATLYRQQAAQLTANTDAETGTGDVVPYLRAPHPRALSHKERQSVLDILHSDRFVDTAPAEVYATLLDEGRFLASERTMYRLLAQAGETGDCRNQRVHPPYQKPELLATAPNQVWSWDITKLKGPQKGTFFSLYVLLDIYSRYVTGWLLAAREQASLAERLIAEATTKQEIPPGQLTVHADRGSALTSQPVAWLLADLGITKSHSRPHTSNDNPFSEAQFKTLKYQPDFPARFGSLEDARAFCCQWPRGSIRLWPTKVSTVDQETDHSIGETC